MTKTELEKLIEKKATENAEECLRTYRSAVYVAWNILIKGIYDPSKIAPKDAFADVKQPWFKLLVEREEKILTEEILGKCSMVSELLGYLHDQTTDIQ